MVMFRPKYGYNPRTGWRIPADIEIQIPDGLTIHLDMQETGNTVLDKSGTENNGTCYDMTNATLPNGDNYKKVTGPNQFISISSSDSYQTDYFTIEVIYLLESLPAAPVANKEGAFRVNSWNYQYSESLIKTTAVGWGSGQLKGNTLITYDTIHQSILVLGGGYRRIYLDGVLEAQAEDAGTLVPNTDEMRLMYSNPGGIFSFRMWDHNLSDSQLNDLYTLFVNKYR